MKRLLILLILCSNAYPQFNQEWVRRYNNSTNGEDDSRAMVLDKYGNIYVAGFSTTSTSSDWIVIKFTPSGVQQWVRTYTGPNGGGRIYAIAADDSANVYVTGYNQGTGTLRDITTIKYSSDGIERWVQRYDGPSHRDDYGWEITLDNFNNVYVAGWSQDSINGDDYIAIKYNSDGVLQWTARYNGTGNAADQIRNIKVNSTGDVFVTGSASGQGIVTIKYNSSGTQQWLTSYNGNVAYGLALDNMSNVYVTGWTPNGTSYDYVTIKYNSSGAQQWAAVYNGTGNGDDQSRWIVLDTLNNVYITGYSINTTMVYSDYTTIKYNTNGQQQWVARYSRGPTSGGYPRSICLDKHSNVYVTGYALADSFDFATVKYNSSGVQQWAAIYDGGFGSDYGWVVKVDSSLNVYVTGASYGSGHQLDIALIKYSQPIGIQPISTEIPNQFSLSQNYPNPFNPNTKIEFRNSKLGFVSLIVFDVLGREVVTLVNEELKPGTYEVDFDGTNYPSGVYYYQLKITNYELGINYLETKKMLLLK